MVRVKQKAIIVDLDGCLFDHSQYEKFLPAENTPEAWEEYHKNVDYYKDMPVNKDVLDKVKDFIAMFKEQGLSTVLYNGVESLSIHVLT